VQKTFIHKSARVQAEAFRLDYHAFAGNGDKSEKALIL